MIAKHRVLLVVALVSSGVAAAVTLYIAKARAAGGPAERPLTYTGHLETPLGVAVDRELPLGLTFYDAEENGDEVCRVASGPTPITGGRFQISLPNACADAVRASPDLWVEVEVQGAGLGRVKLGAVPYALEADHALHADTATAATGALADEVADLSGRLALLEAGSPILRVHMTAADNNAATGTFPTQCINTLKNGIYPVACNLAADRFCRVKKYTGGWLSGEDAGSDQVMVTCVKPMTP